MNSSSQNKTYQSPILTTISISVDYICVIIHIFYCIFMFWSSRLRRKTQLYANHANAVSIIFITTTLISKYNPTLLYSNEAFCSIMEISWIFSKYIRMYSILLIAIYRFISVYNLSWFKAINRSYINLLIPIIVVWFLSISLPLASKYMFRTTTSPTLCLDGYSTSYNLILAYFVFNYTLMAFCPSLTILILYFLITNRLNSIRDRLRKIRAANRLNEMCILQTIQSIQTLFGSHSHINKKLSITAKTKLEYSKMEMRNHKERSFANQFLAMSIFMVLNAVGWSIFQLRNLIPDFYTVWVNWRVVIAIWNTAMVAAIPLISLFFHPSRAKFFGKIRIKLRF